MDTATDQVETVRHGVEWRPTAPRDVVLSWSGGKDSSMALFALRQDPAVNVRYLLTTLTEDYQRVTIHGVRRTLLQRQVAALQAELVEVMIPAQPTHDRYAALMEEAILSPPLADIHTHAFADLYLEDVRAYREANLANLNKSSLFPLWGRNTHALAREFIDLGFNAKVTALDPTVLGQEFCGREFDREFLDDLPDDVDPCGENGEFHTFVYDGPIFREPVPLVAGETVIRSGFVFCDFMPPAPPSHQ